MHYYAFGAPRVGDERLTEYMNEADFGGDSANYVRLNNVIKNGRFTCQFDPVCKFPPKQMGLLSPLGYSLNFHDNSRLRGMSGGLTFNLVFNTFDAQPEYDMIEKTIYGNLYNHLTPLGGACAEHWDYVHSLNAYHEEVIIGHPYFGGDTANPRNIDYYDAIRNLDKYPC